MARPEMSSIWAPMCVGTWLLATGATGIPAGYTAYSHVTSGAAPNANEDAYLFVATGLTVNGVGTSGTARLLREAQIHLSMSRMRRGMRR